jgi:hypothetical protein
MRKRGDKDNLIILLNKLFEKEILERKNGGEYRVFQ